MLGNEFLTHGAESAVDAIVNRTSHPASAPLGARLAIFDEIYKFTRQNRGSVTMLLSLDRHPADGLPEQNQPADLPLAWAKSHGRGACSTRRSAIAMMSGRPAVSAARAGRTAVDAGLAVGGAHAPWAMGGLRAVRLGLRPRCAVGLR